MLNNEAGAATPNILLNPASCANTAAATGGWVDVRQFEGDLLVIQQIGAITGSIDGKLQDATDGSGTGAADVTGATFTQVTSANSVQKISVPAGSVRGWVRYVGTIVTGPALVAASVSSRPKSF